MKKQNTLNVFSKMILGSAIVLSSLAAGASPAEARGIPRFLAEKLSIEQISMLESQTDHESRVALLRSWGIEMPPPPDQVGGRHHLPPFLEDKLSAEQKAQLAALTTREERRALLESWGIEMPPRRGGSANAQ